MSCYGSSVSLKQFFKLILIQPNRFIVQLNLNLGLPVVCFEYFDTGIVHFQVFPKNMEKVESCLIWSHPFYNGRKKFSEVSMDCRLLYKLLPLYAVFLSD